MRGDFFEDKSLSEKNIFSLINVNEQRKYYEKTITNGYVYNFSVLSV